MANYPKITGNSNAAKLDRPTGLNNQNFFETKLTDSVSGKEYIYGVVIIESKGDSGSSVSISDMHIKNAAGVNMSTEHEGTGATFRSNTAIQDAYFTLSPLQKVSSGWTADVPFLGVVKADLNTEKVKTAAWAVASGASGLTQDYFDAVGAGPLAYIKVNKNLALGEIDTINDASTNFSDAEFIIPIYNHAYIEANPISAGEYAAVLIKCDISQGIFDGEKENKLSISHDSIIDGGTSNQDYLITLKVNGVNIFELGSSFMGVDFTSSDSVSSATIYRTIKHIATDIDTGTSWHARDTTNPLHTLVYNEEDNAVHLGIAQSLTIAASGSTFFTGASYPLYFDNADIETAWDANGYIFEDTILSVYDASALVQPFNFLAQPSTNPFFTQADTELQYNTENRLSKLESFTFKHTSKIDSTIYKNGTITATDVSDSSGIGSSLYPNFVASSSKTQQDLAIRGTQGDTVINKTVTANFLVYPQFTYGTTAIALYDKAANLHTNNQKPVSDIVHANDVYVKLNTEASKYCAIADSMEIYKDAEGNTSDIKSKHNVRINVLNDEDVIGSHALTANNSYHKSSGTVKAFTATSENTVLADTAGVTETTAVPTVSQEKLDYTVEVTRNDYNVFGETSTGIYAERNTDGTYKSIDANGGFRTIDDEFRAPITNWQPGHRHGQTWGTQRIPYYHDIYATGKTYKTKGAFFAARPLLHIVPLSKTSGVGTTLVSLLEFVGAPGTTPTTQNNNNGLKDFGTNSYRETSKAFTCSTSSNTNRITNFAVNQGFKTDSQIPGAEVFGLEELFGNVRLFVGPDGFTADAGSAPGFTKLVLENGSDAVCKKTSTANNVTCTFGKPLHNATAKKENFAFTGGVATAQLRSRVFRPYGMDLTCSINRDSSDIIPTDVFVPTNITNQGALNAIHPGSSTAISGLYTASENGVSGGTVDILDLEPKELGITFNGHTEIKSPRFYNGEFARREGTDIPVFYKNIGSVDIVGSTYGTSLSFDLSNLGYEDVLVKKVSLFDPLYIPEGHFTIKPVSAATPTWGIQSATFVDPNASVIDFTTTDLNSSTDNLLNSKKLQRQDKNRLNEFVDYAPSNTTCEVKFSVSTSNAAGTYFQALEVEYYRDEGITQYKKVSDGSFRKRSLSEKRVWTSRVLLQVTIDQASAVEISDADGSVVGENGTFSFGTIQG